MHSLRSELMRRYLVGWLCLRNPRSARRSAPALLVYGCLPRCRFSCFPFLIACVTHSLIPPVPTNLDPMTTPNCRQTPRPVVAVTSPQANRASRPNSRR